MSNEPMTRPARPSLLNAAEELRRYNIRVSVVSPGSVHTEFSSHEGKDAQKMLRLIDNLILGPPGASPEDVAFLSALAHRALTPLVCL